ncbi:MAG: VCBS repeat-containing protein, partial [Thermoanaerobaculales bacterium]|nr:VCBS repeat-containing protein [Thermoanaerobaculales bacterium]
MPSTRISHNLVPLLLLLLAVLTATIAAASPPCHPAGSTGPVQAPVFVRNLSGQTSWYASPLIADLDGNGSNEVIAAYYDIFVFDSAGTLLDRTTDQQGRVYAPHVVADLDGDG